MKILLTDYEFHRLNKSRSQNKEKISPNPGIVVILYTNTIMMLTELHKFQDHLCKRKQRPNNH
jgi:hypothetical protein